MALFEISPDIKTYDKDGRAPIQDLYAAYGHLVTEYGWRSQVVFTQDDLPILTFYTPQKGPALWILAGIHGEEPAGTNALAQNIEVVARLGQLSPIVLFPLCNPWGYAKGWRYPNEERDWKKGKSVSAAEHLLPSLADSSQARLPESSNPAAAALTAKVLEMVEEYPPLLVIDHHEDESLKESYVYSQGQLGADDPVAHKIIELITSAGVSIQMEGTTRFGEKVTQGVIGPVADSSIDELLTAETIILNGESQPGPKTKTVIVVETPTIDVPLETRVAAHSKIIQAYGELLQLRMVE